MRFRAVIAVLLVLLSVSPVWAKGDYDLGKVQVVGKDAQSGAFKPDPQEISRQMGEKPPLVPEILPDPADSGIKPLTEKILEDKPSPKAKKDYLSIGVGAGTRSSRDLKFSGKGSYNGYTGEFLFNQESRNGYRSIVDDTKNHLGASLKSSGDGSFDLVIAADYDSDEFAQRGARGAPTPTAGIKDTTRSFALKGNSTLADGAFFSGYAKIADTSRNTNNRATAFAAESSVFSSNLGGEYLLNLKKDWTGKASLDVVRDGFEITDGQKSDHTKRALSLSAEHTFNDRAFMEIGVKGMAMRNRSRTAPVFRFDYHWDKTWQVILSYDEDLGNADLRSVYLPRRSVGFADLRASHLRRTRGRLNYRPDDRTSLGVELFSEREAEAAEYVDRFDPVRGMLVSDLRFAGDARRSGMKFGGQVRLDQNFTLGADTIIQNPKDQESGRRLSYEAKRLLDVTLTYRGGPIEAEYTRKALFDRAAYVPVVQVDPGDYSRADLIFRYKVKKNVRAYVKIRDLYDDAKKLRYDVPEEGRVSTAGIEADF